MSHWYIFPALHEEAKEGWVWASRLDHPAVPHILLKNPKDGRSLVCEQHLIENHFRTHYDRERKVSFPRAEPLPQGEDVVVISAFS